MSVRWGLALVLLACLSGVVRAETPEFDAVSLEFFEKHVRPILANRCYECHSEKLEEPKGGLKLDSRAATLAGGETGPGVVPGNLKESLVIDAVQYGDLFQMPPKTKLPAEEVATLVKWVEMGAPWPREAAPTATAKKAFDLEARKASHWCWQPLKPQTPPAVQNTAWAKSPIDAFILAKLEAKGLSPNGPADKRVLIRRAYFDLIGLPPTPAQVEAFVKDESPDAFAKVIDELLKSKHFGERWGRHWLDLVRYAESRGHEFDYDIPNAWHYRDYVIRALNADVPYDRFVTEHIAGDLLSEPRLNVEEGFNESVLATGFWHLGEWVHSPVDIRKDECDRFDNMVDVFSKTFLALTVSCARCHDHKFDAISQKDYYALFGYLQSSEYRQARFDTEHHDRKIAKELAKVDEAAQMQTLAAYRMALGDRLKELPGYLEAAQAVLATSADARAEKLKSTAEAAKLDAELLSRWVDYLSQATTAKDDLFEPLANILTKDAAANAALAERQKGLAERLKQKEVETRLAADRMRVIVDYAQSDSPWITDGVAFGQRPITPGELILRTDGQSPLVIDVAKEGMARRDPRWKGLTRAPGTQVDPGQLSRFEAAGQALRTPTFEITHDRIAYLVQGAGRAFAAIDSHRLLNGPLHGQSIKEWDNAAGARWIVQDLSAYRGHRIHVEFSPRGDEDLRVMMVICGDPPNVTYVTPEEAVAPAITQATNAAELYANYSQLLRASLDDASLVRGRAWVIEHLDLLLTTSEREKLQQRLQAIGTQYQRDNDRLTAQIKRVSRTAPAMWDGNGEDERLLVRGNATTPKEIVPRRFLTALVGEQATNDPQGSGRLQLAQQILADDNPLTSRVMANRVWHHLMGRGLAAATDNFGVLGQEPTHPELLDYLAIEFRREGWSVKRLIRTIMLSSTYQMSSTPGEADKELDPQNLLWHRANIRRLQAEVIRDQMLALSGRLSDHQFGPAVPVFLTPYMQGRGRPGSGPLDGDGRRSIYVSVRRNFLSPMMLAFDGPVPFSTMGKRNVSNVPAQALTLMNDPLVIAQAKLWAQRSLADSSLETTDARVTRLYEQAFARQPSADELAAAQAFLTQQAAEYKLSPEQAQRDERVWGDLCHVLMNVKEFIFVP